jgi:hypothetical protein
MRNSGGGARMRCTSTGDPHVHMFAGVKGHPQGEGPYILAQNADKSFVVQACHVRVNSQVSKNNAIAIKTPSGVLKKTSGGWQVPAGSGIVCRGNACTLPGGETVGLAGSSIHLELPSQYCGQVSGLCGAYNPDGNFADAYKLASGGVLNLAGNPVRWGGPYYGNYQTQFTDGYAATAADTLFSTAECAVTRVTYPAVIPMPFATCPAGTEELARAQCPAGERFDDCVMDVGASCDLTQWVAVAIEAPPAVFLTQAPTPAPVRGRRVATPPPTPAPVRRRRTPSPTHAPGAPPTPPPTNSPTPAPPPPTPAPDLSRRRIAVFTDARRRAPATPPPTPAPVDARRRAPVFFDDRRRVVTSRRRTPVCTSGTFLLDPHVGPCLPCPAGKYRATTDGPLESRPQRQATCIACDAGAFQPGVGQAVCLACPTGKYQSAEGTASCLSCPAGKFSDAQASSACAGCEAGTFQSVAGAVSCAAHGGCLVGYHRTGASVISAGACTPNPACPAGKHRTGASHTFAGSCVACPLCGAGKYLEGCSAALATTTAGACKSCASGKFRELSAANSESGSDWDSALCSPTAPFSCAERCAVCPAGKFAAQAAQAVCADCDLQQECVPGSFRTGCGGRSAGSCVACDPSAATGHQYLAGCSGTSPGVPTACEACPAGEFRSGCQGLSAGICIARIYRFAITQPFTTAFLEHTTTATADPAGGSVTVQSLQEQVSEAAAFSAVADPTRFAARLEAAPGFPRAFGHFEIVVGAAGQLNVRVRESSAAWLNYEKLSTEARFRDPSVTDGVRIQMTLVIDAVAPAAAARVAASVITVRVLDVNEPPVEQTAEHNFNVRHIAENSIVGALCVRLDARNDTRDGAVSFVDPDKRPVHSYALLETALAPVYNYVGCANKRAVDIFDIDCEGRLKVLHAGCLDYEANPAGFQLRVKISDLARGRRGSDIDVYQELAVRLINVDEAPVFQGLEQYGATAAIPAAGATNYNGRMLGELAGKAYILEIDENSLPGTPLYPPSDGYAGISAADPDAANADASAQRAGLTYSVAANDPNRNYFYFVGSQLRLGQDAVLNVEGPGLPRCTGAAHLAVDTTSAVSSVCTLALAIEVSSVDVGSTSGVAQTSSASVVVVIRNANDKPELAAVTRYVPENSPAHTNATSDADGLLVGELASATTDEDTALYPQAFAFAVDEDATDPVAFSLFGMHASTGEVFVKPAAAAAGALNFESGLSYALSVRVTDSGLSAANNPFDTKAYPAQPAAALATVTVRLTDVNEAPTLAGGAFTVLETAGVGAEVADLSAGTSDVDAPSQALTYVLLSENSGSPVHFTFSADRAGVLEVAAALDFEEASSYSLQVQVTDNGVPPLSATATVTVTVSDVNEPAVFALPVSEASVPEDAAGGASVPALCAATPYASDPEQGALTYALVAENGRPASDSEPFAFLVDATSGCVSVNSLGRLDFETTGFYALEIEATDPSLLASRATAFVRVGDTNEALRLPYGNSSSMPDAYCDTTTRTAWCDASTVNCEGTCAGTWVQPTAAGSVLFPIAEGSAPAPLGSFYTCDPDADNAATFEVVAGAGTVPAGGYAVHARLTTIASGDCRSVYEVEVTRLFTAGAFDAASAAGNLANKVTVRGTDARGGVTDGVVQLQVRDVATAPVHSPQTFSMSEFADIGDLVGNVTAADADAASVLTYGLSDRWAQVFAIDAATGGLFLKQELLTAQCTARCGCAIDFECSESVVVGITVSDGTFTVPGNVTIATQDVDEPPYWTQSPSVLNITENAAAGTVVGQVSAVDVDVGSTVWYTWATMEDNVTSIEFELGYLLDQDTGTITVSSRVEALDFELRPSCAVTVTAVSRSAASSDLGDDDGDTYSVDYELTLNLLDVDEPPQADAQALEVAEDFFQTADQWPVVLSPLAAFDPEQQLLNFSIVSASTAGLFAVSEDKLVLLDRLDYEALGGARHELVVAATDPGGQSALFNLTVSVQDVNDLAIALVSGPAAGLNTGGGDTVTITGSNFGPLWDVPTVSAVYGAFDAEGTEPRETFAATGCRVLVATGNTQIECTTASGCGTNLAWKVTVSAPAASATGAALSVLSEPRLNTTTTSYRMPTISGLAGHTGLSARGGDTVVVTGSNFGPLGSPVTGFYDVNGNTGFKARSCVVTAAHTEVRCVTEAGSGAGMRWALGVAGQPRDEMLWYPDQSPGFSSYAAPAITGILQPRRCGVFSAAGSVSWPELASADGGGYAAAPAGFRLRAASRTSSYPAASCHDGPAELTASQAMNASWCKAYSADECSEWCASEPRCVGALWRPAGEGTCVLRAAAPGHTVAEAQRTAAAEARGAASDHRVSVCSAGNLTTAGGDFVTLTGTDFGPEAGVAPAATYRNGDGKNYTAADCRIAKPAGAVDTIVCTSAPGVGVGHAWQVTVAAQASAVSVAHTHYNAPSLVGVAGPGAANAPTAGGSRVLVNGTNLGADEAAFSAAYGPADSSSKYAAADCAVIKPHVLYECFTAPGSGANLSWHVSVAGQASAVLPSASAYAKPVVFSLQDVVGRSITAAPTAGGTVVVITGKNFGPAGADSALQLVTYGDCAVFAGEQQTAGADCARREYVASECNVTLADTEIECVMARGGGAKQSWTVTVDGQFSIPPATSYSAPVLLGVASDSKATSRYSTRGGDAVTLTGTSFGNTSDIDAVTYGPTGVEYTAVDCTATVVDQQIVCYTAPGFGRTNYWSVNVQGQVSEFLNASTAYALPLVDGLAPAADGDRWVGTAGSQATVTGYNFGPAAAAPKVLFNGRLLSAAHTVGALEDQPDSLEFTVPEGYGDNTAFVVVGGADADLVTEPLQFSYAPPVVSRIVKSRGPLGTVLPMVLEIHGSNFFTNYTGGKYVGDVELTTASSYPFAADSGAPVFTSDDSELTVVSWTNSKIELVFSGGISGAVRVKVGSAVSAAVAFVTESPVIADQSDFKRNASECAQLGGCKFYKYFPALAPAIDTPRAEAAGGGTLELEAQHASGGATVRVTVGGADCPITLNQPIGEDSATAHRKLRCTLPAGRGAAAPIVVYDDSLSSAAQPLAYRGPTVFWSASVAASAGLGRAGSVLTAPTAGLGAGIWLFGKDFGAPRPAVTVAGADCAVQAGNDTHLWVPIPAGEGAAHTLTVNAGGQSASTEFGYEAPRVDALTAEETNVSATFRVLTTAGANGTGATEVEAALYGARWALVGSNFGDLEYLALEGNASSHGVHMDGAACLLGASACPCGALDATPCLGAAGACLAVNASGSCPVGAVRCAASLEWTHSWAEALCAKGLEAAAGSNLTLTVTGQSATYRAPRIASTRIAAGTAEETAAGWARTAGGATLEILGADLLHASGAPPTVRIETQAGSRVYADCPVTSHSAAAVRCTVPAGSGGGLALQVRTDLLSVPHSFSYLAPTFLGAALVAPVCGTPGGAVTVVGDNFGGAASGAALPLVWLDGSPVACTAFTDTTLEFAAPAGAGGEHSIVVQATGRNTTASWRYEPPALGGLPAAAAAVATDGTSVITLAGSNFGTDPARVALLVGGRLANVTSCTHTRVVCRVPVGQGRNIPFALLVAGQQQAAPASAAAPVVSYAAPTVTAVEPAQGPTGGGTLVTCSGLNFGTLFDLWGADDATVLAVKNAGGGATAASLPLGGVALRQLSSALRLGNSTVPTDAIVSWNHTRIVFRAPEDAGLGRPRPLLIRCGASWMTEDATADDEDSRSTESAASAALNFTYDKPRVESICMFGLQKDGSCSTPLSTNLRTDGKTSAGKDSAPALITIKGSSLGTCGVKGAEGKKMTTVDGVEGVWPGEVRIYDRGELCNCPADRACQQLNDGTCSDGRYGETDLGHLTGTCVAGSRDCNLERVARAARDKKSVPARRRLVEGGVTTPAEAGQLPCTAEFGCSLCAVQSVTHGAIVCAPGAGMGPQHDLIVSLSYDATNMTDLSYAPPQNLRIVSNTTGSTLINATGERVIITGDNFGSMPSEASIAIGDESCVDPAWHPAEPDAAGSGSSSVVALTEPYLSCVLASGTAGVKDVTVRVADQDAAVFEEALVAECKPGDFGAVGTRCRECPVGTLCEEPNMEQPVGDAGFFVGVAAAGSEEEQACIEAGFTKCPVSLPCEPASACKPGNACELGYTGYRCAECRQGYYKLSGECETCPTCSKCVVALFILAMLVFCVVGWFLSRKQINLGILSIGVDYVQVLTILTMSNKISWPRTLKNFFNTLSFFNLNLDLLAPECSYADFKYENKWALIMTMPMMIMGVFLAIYAAKYCHKRFVLGRTAKLHTHGHTLIGAGVATFYYMYLYITKTAFDIFNCRATDPPDGKKYLEVVFEECYAPGGMHMKLLPAAVFFFMLYSLGIPAVIAKILLGQSASCYEDQVLLARGTGSTRATNPNCYVFRKRYRKLYEKFKPEKSYWLLIILFRKFWVACAGLLFRKTPVFLLAFSLMILFVSYALQAMHRPYICNAELPAIVAKADAEAAGSDTVQVELHGHQKKQLQGRLRSGSLSNRAKAEAMEIGHEMWNYNTVEQTLLFTMCLVLISAIMFQSPQIKPGSKMELGLAAWTFLLIMGSLVYFLAVLASEIALGMGWLGSSRAERWFGVTNTRSGVADEDDDEENEKDGVVFAHAGAVKNNPLANQPLSSDQMRKSLGQGVSPAVVAKMKADLAESQTEVQKLLTEVRILKQEKALQFSAGGGSSKKLHQKASSHTIRPHSQRKSPAPAEAEMEEHVPAAADQHHVL